MSGTNLLSTKIEFLKGVGPKKAALLSKELNIKTFKDLLHFFPYRFIDKSKFYTVAETHPQMQSVQIRGTVINKQLTGEKRKQRLVITLKDRTGRIELVWFKGVNWIKDKIKLNEDYVVFGKPTLFNNKINISHPEIEPANRIAKSSNRVKALYHSTEKLKAFNIDSKAIATMIETLLEGLVANDTPEILSEHIIKKFNFPTRYQAYNAIHQPKNGEDYTKALQRLKFDELFFLQLKMVMDKRAKQQASKGFVFKELGHYFNTFYNEHLPFPLTGAQKRVIKEIRNDVLSGHQMNRLLQGDVGSGKTITALMILLMAIDNGYQTCLMAPTEILANQHFVGISELLFPLGLKVELLTGSVKGKKREALLERLKLGDIDILIGTHALIEDPVQYKNIGMVIIDEQHRFGVAQRAKLYKKNSTPPHVLVMTATPIPRTLALTVYGNLDTSVIDELPPGRKEVKTVHRLDAHRLRVFGFLLEEIKKGRQVYIVYPLIEGNEKLDYKDLTDGYESLDRAFRKHGIHISLVHGRMKPADKEYEMQRFVKNETQIMVATTVIEVGVNVPNASVMIIESSERFGLSQLHQLRGRVGRGAEQSYCILMTKEKISDEAKIRTETMCKTNDGFKIAEVDLSLRGPGDIAGTQQSGVSPLQLANLSTDAPLVGNARIAINELLKDDPMLEQQENRLIKQHLLKLLKSNFNWSKIS